MTANYHGGYRKENAPERSRQLRGAATDAEQALWRRLHGRQLGHVKFRRQHPFGRYILDFFCAERGLAIEADGGQHFSAEGREEDEERGRYLAARGVRVLRFTNLEILQEMDSVIRSIEHALEGG